MKNTSGLLSVILAFAFSVLAAQPTDNSNPADHIMPVVRCSNFELTAMAMSLPGVPHNGLL